MAKAGDEAQAADNGKPKGLLNRFLNAIEVVGNKLPDPAILFLLLLFLTWIASALLAPVQFADIHPVTGEPVRIQNQLTGEALATFMARLVTTFTGFAPLGHPLAGIGAAFAGVSGGFSANFIPSGIDPLLQGFTQSAAQILDPEVLVNPLCNLLFTALSSILVVAVGWYLTDRVIEPRLRGTEIDGDPDEMPKMEEPSRRDRLGFLAGMGSLVLGLVVLLIWAWPETSPLRGEAGELTAFSAPLMQMLVPLIFVFFLIPGVVHGYVAGTVKTHRDIVDGMSDA
ncbi:MAG: AbgT family transporter, partial [Acidobacteriota bacterium]|nr:AbgT family transporter [Acidobacteriota bacterium]